MGAKGRPTVLKEKTESVIGHLEKCLVRLDEANGLADELDPENSIDWETPRGRVAILLTEISLLLDCLPTRPVGRPRREGEE